MRKKHYYIRKSNWYTGLNSACEEAQTRIQQLYDSLNNRHIYDLEILDCKLATQSFENKTEYCFVIQYTYHTLDN